MKRNSGRGRCGALLLGALLGGLIGIAPPAKAQSPSKSATLDAVKKRGQLICGVDTGIPGYAYQDSAGKWQGLDVALCRVIAVAVLGDAEKVKFVGLNAKVRFTVLASGEVDVLIRDSELTLARNGNLGLGEPAANFFTGQTFMVKKSLGVAHTKDLNGATICLETGTTLETNIADYNRANNIKINTLLFEKPEEAFAAVEAGRCDGYTDDGGSVAAARSTMKVPGDWVFLPETIGREPLGPYVRSGDDGWFNIVKWSHFAMLEGEVRGLTRENIDAKKTGATDPELRKFVGLEGGLGNMLGLDAEWSYRIVKTVGSYGQVYDETFGAKGLGLPRGMNALWTNGGLMIPYSWY